LALGIKAFGQADIPLHTHKHGNKQGVKKRPDLRALGGKTGTQISPRANGNQQSQNNGYVDWNNPKGHINDHQQQHKERL
jgi:hypothetical protein